MTTIAAIQSDLRIIKEIAIDIGEKPVLISINELDKKLTDNHFYLVILGLFKRGKSSLINALIGKNLAPVAITPLTSVITFFEYGLETTAEVIYEDCHSTPVDISEVVNFVTEENNPKNEKHVKYVRITTKSRILENLTLIDTPGFGSIFNQNSEITSNFIPRIDAALFVLSADVPISKADEEFLMQMKSSVTNILFVQNKSDLLNKSDLEKIIRYNLKMLSGIFHKDPLEIKLISVSARKYFEEGDNILSADPGNITQLKENIYDHIIGIKDEILLSRSIIQLLHFADHINTLLSLKTQTLLLPLHELEKKRDTMQSSIDFLSSGKEDFDAVLKNRVQQLINDMTSKTGILRDELLRYCQNLFVENSSKTWNSICETDADIYFQILYEYILARFDELKSQLEKSVKNDFSNILSQYCLQSQSFLSKIVIQMEEILNVKIGNIISVFDLDIYTSFYFKTDLKFSIPSLKKRWIYKILPNHMVKKIILKQMYANCLEIINPNAGRIRSDIDYKINESFRKFKFNFENRLFELLQSLKSIIDISINTKLSLSENLDQILEHIKFQHNRIEKIRKNYDSIKTVSSAE